MTKIIFWSLKGNYFFLSGDLTERKLKITNVSHFKKTIPISATIYIFTCGVIIYISACGATISICVSVGVGVSHAVICENKLLVCSHFKNKFVENVSISLTLNFFFFWGGGVYVFQTRCPIGSVPCVPSYTLRSPRV